MEVIKKNLDSLRQEVALLQLNDYHPFKHSVLEKLKVNEKQVESFVQELKFLRHEIFKLKKELNNEIIKEIEKSKQIIELRNNKKTLWEKIIGI